LAGTFSYSFDAGLGKVQIKGNDYTLNCTLTEKAILEYLHEHPTATQTEIAKAVGRSLRAVKMDMTVLQKKGLLERKGAKKSGRWEAANNGNNGESL
jgi:predicted ArsR family transcriptional regulator